MRMRAFSSLIAQNLRNRRDARPIDAARIATHESAALALHIFAPDESFQSISSPPTEESKRALWAPVYWLESVSRSKIEPPELFPFDEALRAAGEGACVGVPLLDEACRTNQFESFSEKDTYPTNWRCSSLALQHLSNFASESTRWKPTLPPRLQHAPGSLC